MVTYLPVKIRLSVLFILLSEQTIDFMIPTYLAYMMEGFLADPNLSQSELEAKISYYSGTLEGLNRLMSFFGCLIWGTVSDKIGRKYSLMIVLCGIMIASICFGLATSYEMAVLCRMVAGLFGGTIPIAKAMLRDLSDDSNIAILYSYLGTGYGIAAVIGPLIGGLFSHPYRNFDFLDIPIFHTYPYILPQAIHATIIIFTLFLIHFCIPNKPPEPTSIQDTKELVKNKNYIISVSIFCMIAVVQFSYRLLMSLWVKASRDIGGLGWQIEEYPGYMNSGSGVFIALFPFFLTPYLSHKYGVKKSCLITIFFMIPVVFLISWCYLLYGIPMWVCLILLNGLSNALSTVFINFISIAVSNSVSPNITGAALGICQSVTALCRSVATGTTGVLYGSNQGWGLSFPLDSHFMFILIDIILITNFIFILTNMKPELEKRKITDEEIPLINKNN